MAFSFEEFPNSDFYNSDLREILTYMRKFKKTLESYAEAIDELKEALEDINDWETRIVALEKIPAQISSIISTLNSHNADINVLKGLINDLQSQIDTIDLEGLKNYIDSHDKLLKADYIAKIAKNYEVTFALFNGLKERLEILAQLVANIDTMAYNPWSRVITKESLQTNLNYTYSDLADIVPTAMEYSELGLTASEYNNYDLLARDYSLFGRFKLKMHYIFSPAYGFKQELNNVLTSIINFCKGTMSANEYTALNITADEYTALNITANEYYSYGNSQGVLALGGDGITAGQYSTIHTI